MTKEEARKAAEVMSAYADGAEVEYRYRMPPGSNVSTGPVCWEKMRGVYFDFYRYEYRVKPSKPSIDWSAVSKEYNFLMITNHGGTFCIPGHGYGILAAKEPEIIGNDWRVVGARVLASAFASFKPGNCDWRDSLVMRPGYESKEG